MSEIGINKKILVCYIPPVEEFNIYTGEKVGNLPLKDITQTNYGLFISENLILFSCVERGPGHGYGNRTERFIMEYDYHEKKELRRSQYVSHNIWHILKPKRHEIVVTSGWNHDQLILDYRDLKVVLHKVSYSDYIYQSEYCDWNQRIIGASSDKKVKVFSLHKKEITSELTFNTLAMETQYIEEKNSIFCLTKNRLFQYPVQEFDRKRENKVVEKIGATFYSFRLHDDGNLVAIGGYDSWQISDLRKFSDEPIFIVTQAGGTGIGEIWRQQKVNRDQICFGASKECQVRDWNGKLIRSWATKARYANCCCFSTDQLSKVGFLHQQVLEDLEERKNYLIDSITDSPSHFKIDLSGNEIHCFFGFLLL